MTTHDLDKIIAAAIKSGLGEAFWLSPQHPDFEEEMGMLERFYAIAFENGRQAERKECAKLCEDEAWGGPAYNSAANYLAEAIRARGDSK